MSINNFVCKTFSKGIFGEKCEYYNIFEECHGIHSIFKVFCKYYGNKKDKSAVSVTNWACFCFGFLLKG
jgi:hypothetical protein